MAKGFNRPAGGGGQAGMLQQLQRMQQQMAEAQEKLALTMSGDQKCQLVEIDPALLKDVDAEMLQDLVLTAVNLALDKSRELQEQRLGPLAGGLPF
jgi:DNA-binding protein YbaB